MPRRMTLWVALTALLAAPGLARADDPPAAPAAPDSSGSVVELGVLLESVAKRTGLVFVWSPDSKQMQKRIRLTGDPATAGPTDLPSLRRLLIFHELVIVAKGPPGQEIHVVLDVRQTGVLLQIVPEQIALNDATVARYEHAEGVFVTAQIRTSGALNLRELRMAISRMVTQQNIGNATEMPDTATLVVTDFAPAVCAIYRFVRAADAEANARPARTTTLVALRHANAAETAQILTESLTPPVAPAAAPGAQPAAPAAPRVVADIRTNQLLVTGTPQQIQHVTGLIQGLDVPAPPPREAAKEPPPAPSVAVRRASALGQRLTINVTEAPFADVLTAVVRAAGLELAGPLPVVDGPKVTLAVKDMPAREVLDVLVAQSSLSWRAAEDGRIEIARP